MKDTWKTHIHTKGLPKQFPSCETQSETSQPHCVFANQHDEPEVN